MNPDQAIDISTMPQVVSTTIAEPRFLAVLLGGFAGLSIVLAMLGVYGVTAHEASRRRYEVGLRIALGARAPDVPAAPRRAHRPGKGAQMGIGSPGRAIHIVLT